MRAGTAPMEPRGALMRELWRANLRKEWIVHGSLLVDYVVVAVTLVTLLPLDGPGGFGLLASFLAASLGARIGGDEAMWGAREFVYTRPVRRRDWVRLRFALGLLPIGGLLVLFLVADAADLHRRFVTLLAEPLEGDADSTFRPALYLPFVAAAALTYALAFRSASREPRPEHVLSHRAGAWILGGFLSLVALVLVHQVFRAWLGWLEWSDEVGVETSAMAASVAGALTPMVLVAYRSTVRGVERLEVAGDGLAGPTSSRRANAGVNATILVLLLVIVAAIVWLGLAPAVESVAPVVETDLRGRDLVDEVAEPK